MSDFALSPEHYTLKNALLWGNCVEHGKMASQGNCCNCTVHVIIVALECLPGVGQIISIFEMIIVRCCCKPSPKPNLSHIKITPKSPENISHIALDNLLLPKKNLKIDIHNIEDEEEEIEVVDVPEDADPVNNNSAPGNAPSATPTENKKTEIIINDNIKTPPPAPKPLETPPAAPKKVPNIFKDVEELCENIITNMYKVKSPLLVQAKFKALNMQCDLAVNLLTELIDAFNEDRYRRKYKHPQDAKRSEVSCNIKFKDQVPAYFANDKGEYCDFERKYLAMAGIRNLLFVGPKIIDELYTLRFLGGKHHYPPGAGLNAFEYYTGNTIDLDTPLDDSIKNDQEAIKQAVILIKAFIKKCNITEPDVIAKRKLYMDPVIVPMSTDNLDRSNYGVWKYKQYGSKKIHYVVNVPSNMDLTTSIALLFPYQMAELVHLEKEKNGGKLSQEFLDDFFENAISDKCYNDKIATFALFYADYKSKLEKPAISGIENLRNRIEKGECGPALQKMGFDAALKSALTRQDLISILDMHRDDADWTNNDLSFFKNLLSGYLGQMLYRTDAESDACLFNDAVLKTFIADYKEYIKSLLDD